MSDTIHPLEADRRRTLTSLAAALCIHVAVLAIMALAFALRGPSTEFTMPIDVQIDSGREGAGQELSQGSAPGPASSPAHASTGALPSQGSSGSGGFVIPTVRTSSPDSAPPAGGGPSFRVAGWKTGSGAALPAVQNQLPPPAVAAGPQGTSAGAAAGSSAGTQRSGEGVSVGQSSSTAGPLDLGKLDQAIAGRGAGTPGAAGATAGAGQSGGTPGQAGAGGGRQGQGGGGGGTGGTGTGGTGGAGAYRVVWDQPEANKGRMLLSSVEPRLPAWVSKQGLTLTATVSFVVMPDGVVSVVSIERSTGYADVDSAFKDAIHRWRFSAAKGTLPMTGLIPYVVKPK